MLSEQALRGMAIGGGNVAVPPKKVELREAEGKVAITKTIRSAI